MNLLTLQNRKANLLFSLQCIDADLLTLQNLLVISALQTEKQVQMCPYFRGVFL